MESRDLASRRAAKSGRAPSDQRDQAARRFKTFWPTEMRRVNEQHRVHVLNISRTGAKIHAREAMDINQTLEIVIGGERRGATVRWKLGQTFGIVFDEPISDDIVFNNLIAG